MHVSQGSQTCLNVARTVLSKTSLYARSLILHLTANVAEKLNGSVGITIHLIHPNTGKCCVCTWAEGFKIVSKKILFLLNNASLQKETNFHLNANRIFLVK